MDEKEKPALKERLQLKKRSKKLKRRARKVEGATVRHARRFLVDRWDKIREIRFHIIAWLGGVGLLIGLVGLQMLWFQRSYITDAPVSGGTYAEALKGPVNTLNPLFATTPAELAASHLLFSSLYANDTSGHLHSDLAAGISNTDDKEFIVKMRHDARWEDGKPLTAADVVYTVGLMKSPAARSVMTASWQGVEAYQIDDYTVQFTLPAAYAAFPQALTFAVLPKHVLKDLDPTTLRESSFSTSPVGSGPFNLRLLQIVSQTTGRKIIHLDANNNYYAGRPRLDRFQLHVYPDDDSIAHALRTNEVSAASNVTSAIAESIDKNNYDVTIRPVNSGVYALFNLIQPTLKDASVRKALQLGTDTAAIRKQIFGNPRPLNLPFISSQVRGSENIAIAKPDKDAAMKLLDKNGWVMKDGVRMKGADRLHLRLVTRKKADYETVLQQLAGQWRQMGVEVDVVVADPATFTQDVLHDRNYDVLVDELVIGGDPDVFAYWDSRGLLNFTSYSNQTSDDALAGARTRSDPQLRDLKYVAFAKQWVADAPAIGLYQSNLLYVHSPSTRSIGEDETIISPEDHYAGVRYWTAEKGKVYKTP